MPILFDVDDTLLDDRGAQDEYLRTLYSHHRSILPYADQGTFVAAWRASIQRHFARYLKGELTIVEQRRARIRDVFGDPGMSSRKVDSIVDDFLTAYECAWRLFPDALATLTALGSSALGVITNGDTAQQIKKLQRTGIHEMFSVIVVSDAVGHAKPAPEIFACACARLEARPKDCVFVGDDWEKDVEGALGANLFPVWLSRDGSQPVRRREVPTITTLAALTDRAEIRLAIERQERKR